MGQTLIEKIVEKHAVNPEPGKKVRSGDYITIRPAHVMTHDNTGAVLKKFKSIDVPHIADPSQPVFALDHNVGDKSPENIGKYQKIESFAKEMGVDFYPAGHGIGHQIMCEEGYVWPFTMVVASDSHSNMYGGLGALGTPIVRTDASALWATGKTWWQVPRITKVELTGKLRKGVTGKDIILALAGIFNNDEVLNHAIEFTGEGISDLSIDSRLTIANMTTEWGALAGVFPVDEVTLSWFEKRSRLYSDHPRINKLRIQNLSGNILTADPNAFWAGEITLNMSSIVPYASGPGNVKTTTPVARLEDKCIKIHKAYLVSCVNSRASDLSEASRVLKGKKIHPNIEFYIAAASKEVEMESKKSGDWETLISAGARPLLPGCGPCIGLGEGLLKENETGISATNRNFKGRMGHPSAKVYLASPAVVAASALKGKISLPEGSGREVLQPEATFKANKQNIEGSVNILDGFPETLEGEIVFCHQDNLNTDGIYPGKYTYRDDMTPADQAKVAMENYDPEFTRIVKTCDILAAGFNFGTGSSREQAATALKHGGIKLLLAGSFSETYKRNAINNGFHVIESPNFIKFLKARYGTEKLTLRTGIKAKISFSGSTLEADGKTYSISPTGPVAQELILSGGLEAQVKKQLAEKNQ